MNTRPTASRIHPLMAGAAISATVLCLVGAASIAGILPNFYFHVSMVHAILRNNGVAVGKLDYLGPYD